MFQEFASIFNVLVGVCHRKRQRDDSENEPLHAMSVLFHSCAAPVVYQWMNAIGVILVIIFDE